MMDIYLLFGGMVYYPEGGLLDYDTHYLTLEVAQERALVHLSDREFSSLYWEWANIAHVTQDGIVERWEWRGGGWETMK